MADMNKLQPYRRSKKYLVTRRVSDPREGDLGNIRLIITANTGAEAAALANTRTAEINAKFERDLQTKGLYRWWHSSGWEQPELLVKRFSLGKLPPDYDPMSDEETGAMLQMHRANRKGKNG